MVFGLIAEGRSDCAVIRNILYGLNLIDTDNDLLFLRPEFEIDATTQSKEIPIKESAFSNWTLVKKDCETTKLKGFLLTDNIFLEERKIILQIDTAECEETGYEVQRPNKNQENYSELLRTNVIRKIQEWVTDKEVIKDLLYAVCIEEMDAWVHVLYENKDTSKSINAKEAFNKCLKKLRTTNKSFAKKEHAIKNRTLLEKYDFYSSDFEKIQKKKIKVKIKNNRSLEQFIESLLEPNKM